MSRQYGDDQHLEYEDCSCIDGPRNRALQGTCKADCITQYFFAVIVFITIVLFFIPTLPAIDMTRGEFQEELHTLSLSVQMVALKAFGTIPGPIGFGHLIDKACILFAASCVVYGKFKFGLFTALFVMVAKGVGIVLAAFAYRLVRRSNYISSGHS